MIFYLAPLEGITGYIFRNAWRDSFGGADKYITPFISPNTKKCFTAKEKKDILPEHNQGMQVIPQILTNQAPYFIDTAKRLKEYGYEEVNLNLGCPSATVAAKKKGAGFLAYPEDLDRFLEEIFEGVFQKERMRISIKTRLGVEEEEEFSSLLRIYNQYPVEELIIHPRLQQDFYKKPVHLDFFREVYGDSQAAVCYNGDVFTPGQYREFADGFSDVGRLMLGRGILVNPGLVEEIETGTAMEKEQLYAFLERLCRDYTEVLFDDKTVLYKLKELWFYLGHSFQESEGYMKKIKKAHRLDEYWRIVNQLFDSRELRSWK